MIKKLIQATADFLLPRICPVCNHALGAHEQFLCSKCLSHLPRTQLEHTPFNAMEQLFAGKVPIERATAFFYYEKASPYSAIIHDIKYRNMPQMGTWLAQRAVDVMTDSGVFDGIDIVIPVPLHIDRLVKRGYNQAQAIAQGIALATGATLVCNIIIAKSHTTQTQKSAYERYFNTRDTYTISSHATAQLENKHVMLVDDVVTTGATLIACAEAISHISNIKISIFTLAAARLTY